MARVLARLAATTGLTVAAAGAITALPATSVAPALGAAHCAAADTPAHVAFVVDFGSAAGAPGGVTQACVSVPSSDTGTEALAELSRLEGWPAPTYADSGLLCSIDGFPKSCQTSGGPPEAYWSYWFGTSQWTFANAGPASQSGSALAGRAQGWRFQPAGQGNGTDPAPRGPSDPATICAAGVLSAPAPAPAPAPSGASHSAPAVHPGAGQRAGSVPGPAATTSTVAAGAPAAVTTPGAAGPTTVASPTTAGAAAQAVAAAPTRTGPGERRVATRPIRSVSTSGGSALPVLITVIALAVLGASGGYYRRRRRHAPEET